MCRHVAHIGAPTPLDRLLFGAPRSLCEQGRDAREMLWGTSNPDGWGVAWWTDPRRPPRHYRSTTSMWDDHSFPGDSDHSPALLGAIRMASPGSTRRTENNAPFVATTKAGTAAFSLNGWALHPSCEHRVRALRPADIEIVGDTDSEILFAAVRERIGCGADPATAVAAVHRAVAPNREVALNMLLVQADLMIATTWRNTLYVHARADGTTVASEPLTPYDDWTRVPDASLLVATPTNLRIEPLEGHGSP